MGEARLREGFCPKFSLIVLHLPATRMYAFSPPCNQHVLLKCGTINTAFPEDVRENKDIEFKGNKAATCTHILILMLSPE